MTRAVVHGALLLLMLIAGFVTWTAEDRPETDDATFSVWQHDSDDVARVTYRSPNRTIELERRGSGGARHLWAVQTDSVPAAARDSVAADTAAAANLSEYPVGEEGETMIADLARLRVLRDLGEATGEKHAAYGIADSVPTVTLRLRNGTERVLAVGRLAPGGGSRYVQDIRGNRIYVVPASLLRPLEMGGDMLRLTRVQPFEGDDVASVTVRAATTERTMRRRTQGPAAPPLWNEPGSDRPDEAFANFMTQIDQLWVARFLPAAPDTLERIVRIDYFDDDGDALGFLELFRTRATEGSPAYLMRTGRTIVFGEVYAPLAERVEQDVATLLTQSNR